MKYEQGRLGQADSVQWKLEEAKARFSEVVRRAQQRPQHVSVRGRATAVVLSAETFARLMPESKKSLANVLRESPLQDIDFGDKGEPMPVREVEL
jgi:prevent-host-death family protein